MARPKLIDVARIAGVSVGTASDALAGKNRIPEETRQRVRDAAAELGYQPNRVAKALQQGHLPLIGLVVSSLRRRAEFDAFTSYWLEVIGTASVACADRGYALSVLPQFADSELSTLPIAALIVMDAQADDSDVRWALEHAVPLATDAPDVPRGSAFTLPWDFSHGVRIAMDHFLESGAKQPALLATNLATPYESEIAKAYAEWCALHGRAQLVERLAVGDSAAESAALHRLIQAGADAVFVTVPGVSTNAVEVATRHQRHLPRVLIALLDDDADAKLTALGLTTVQSGTKQVIERAIEELVTRVRDEHTPYSDIRNVWKLSAQRSSLPREQWDGTERRAGDAPRGRRLSDLLPPD